jgi:hypothetical protein
MNGQNGTIQIARMFCPIHKWQDMTKMVEQIAGQIAKRTEQPFPSKSYPKSIGWQGGDYVKA